MMMRSQRHLILVFGKRTRNEPVTAAMAPEAPMAGWVETAVWMSPETTAPAR